jgi:fucose permease
LAAIMAVPVVPALLATYPTSAAAFQFARALAMLTEPTVWVAGLALFCYAALDISFSNWLPAFGKEVLTAARPNSAPDAVDASAQRLISVYAVSLICGRLTASLVPALVETLKDHGSLFVAVASLAAAALIVWMALTRRAALAWLLVFAVGLLSAPFFPTIVGITFAKYSPEVYGSVFGIIFAGALLGGATVPKAIGNLAKGSSIQKSMALLAPLCLVLVGLALLLGRL